VLPATRDRTRFAFCNLQFPPPPPPPTGKLETPTRIYSLGFIYWGKLKIARRQKPEKARSQKAKSSQCGQHLRPPKKVQHRYSIDLSVAMGYIPGKGSSHQSSSQLTRYSHWYHGTATYTYGADTVKERFKASVNAENANR
jgi:hypothetical protein